MPPTLRSTIFQSLLPVILVATPLGAQDLVSYTVEFVATWSSLTHPEEFPGNPHFSGLIGGTHDTSVEFWAAGELASDGIEAMAERGRKSPLDAEVQAAIDAGSAEFILSGGGISMSPGKVSLDFEISDQYPLVSLVSMIAPSPDWFVGVRGLPLRENGTWIDVIEVPLYVYDAGTDSGPSYTSPNDDTNPAEAIELLTEGPFASSGLLGSFIFRRMQVSASDPPDVPSDVAISDPYPNPAAGYFLFDVGTEEVGSLGSLKVRLLDVTGRTVAGGDRATSGGSSGTRIRVNVADLPPGMYFVEVESRTRLKRAPFVIVR